MPFIGLSLMHVGHTGEKKERDARMIGRDGREFPQIKERMMGLVAFYRDSSHPGNAPYSLESIWGMDDNELDCHHDFIQWLFPTDTPSQYNDDAPILTPDMAKIFREDADIQRHMRRSLERFQAFLGMARNHEGNLILVRRPAYAWGSFTHNHLRITRVLRSLGLAGLTTERDALWVLLRDSAEDSSLGITRRTLAFWQQAALD